MRMPKLSRLAGGTSPEGAEGGHAHGNTTPDASTDNINDLKKGKITLVYAPQPYGPPPLQGGGVAMPFRSLCGGHYGRASARLVFPLRGGTVFIPADFDRVILTEP